MKHLMLTLFMLSALTCAVYANQDYDLHHERPETFHLEKVDLFGKSFYVGSVHYNWVIQQEKGVLDVLNRALKDKQGACVAVDVGMNDGFYTHLSAQYGCTYPVSTARPCVFRTAHRSTNSGVMAGTRSLANRTRLTTLRDIMSTMR